MNLSLIRSMTRSAVFELENGLCFRPASTGRIPFISDTSIFFPFPVFYSL